MLLTLLQKYRIFTVSDLQAHLVRHVSENLLSKRRDERIRSGLTILIRNVTWRTKQARMAQPARMEQSASRGQVAEGAKAGSCSTKRCKSMTPN
jgi:hypothetical protein